MWLTNKQNSDAYTFLHFLDVPNKPFRTSEHAIWISDFGEAVASKILETNSRDHSGPGFLEAHTKE